MGRLEDAFDVCADHYLGAPGGRAFSVATIFNHHAPALEELAEAEDGDELCRLLLESPWGWGSSTQHREAVELLERVPGRGELGDELVALLLWTCRRWDRVTAKLIDAIEDSGLMSDADLRSGGGPAQGWPCPPNGVVHRDVARAISARRLRGGGAHRRDQPATSRFSLHRGR
jgi:hypothetical protein